MVADGGDGSDSIFGGFGDDELDYGPGPDNLFGRDGNDVLDGGFVVVTTCYAAKAATIFRLAQLETTCCLVALVTMFCREDRATIGCKVTPATTRWTAVPATMWKFNKFRTDVREGSETEISRAN